jgi:hypothetical protein
MINMLGFETRQKLDTSTLVFDGDGLARIVGQGSSYGGGFWEATFYAFTPEMKPVNMDVIIGGCGSERAGNSQQGYFTMYAWLEDQLEQVPGMRLAGGDDRNHERPADERPFFLAGLFIVDRRG